MELHGHPLRVIIVIVIAGHGFSGTIGSLFWTLVLLQILFYCFGVLVSQRLGRVLVSICLGMCKDSSNGDS